MSPRAWNVLPAIATMMFSTVAHGQNYQELSAMVAGPWHHVPDARSTLEFNREMAKCQVVSAQTLVSSTTPAVVEIARWRVLINCLKASGYEPGNAAVANPTDLSGVTGPRYSDYSCAQIAKLRKSNPGIDAFFLIWTRGFKSGWTSAPKDEAFKIDPAAIPPDKQTKILRKFCEENPSKIYFGAVMDLIVRLKKATEGQGDGKTEE
jgi:hypothetical protein